jgi:hypothetical protein
MTGQHNTEDISVVIFGQSRKGKKLIRHISLSKKLSQFSFPARKILCKSYEARYNI